MDDTKFSRRRRAWGAMMRALMMACAALTCALAAFLILYVLAKGVPHLSWQLLSTKPSYLDDTIGILPDVISTVCMVLATLLVVLPLLFVWLSAEFGLLMDLKRPNLVWTNEITVIKQRITVLLVMLAGWLYAAAIAALYFVVGADMGAAWYLLAWSVLTAALAVLLRRWLRRSGSRLLGRLA